VHTTKEASRPAELDPFLRLPFVELATGIKKSLIYALMKRGEFPRSVQITPRCVAWRKSRITQWLEDTQAAADKAAAAQAAGDKATDAPQLPLPEGGAQ